jgi:hypothetical protein
VRAALIFISLFAVLLAAPGAMAHDPGAGLPYQASAPRILDRSSLPALPPGSNFYDTSEFMLGSTAMVYILPESDGTIDPDLENWTQAEQDTVTAGVLRGLDWWVRKAKWRDVTFIPVFRYSVPTGYEPISRSTYDEHLWVSDALSSMGYDQPHPMNMYECANHFRDSLGTDWAVLIFIADSSDDEDGLFANGVAAYSYLGGPNTIMSYKNGYAGIELMHWVMSHEMAHSYYAWDEYHVLSPPCTASIGYLNVQNQNSIGPDGPGGCDLNIIKCIMRLYEGPDQTACLYTKGQIGWWDSDVDSIPDILDTFPETVLYSYSPDPCSTATPTYTGTCNVVPLPNRNPYGEGNDITLEVISGVEFRVDSGAWLEALPVDGAWDEAAEDFYMTTSPLSAGLHVVEARAVQTCGNADTTAAADTLTVSAEAGVVPGGPYAGMHIAVRPNPSAGDIGISYTVPGTRGGVDPVTVTVYDVKGRAVRLLVSRIEGQGRKRATWDGALPDGNAAPSGIYFIRVAAGEATGVAKFVLVR